jgi:hypothetical protein
MSVSQLERATAFVIDNRDGRLERIRGHGISVHSARAHAFHTAQAECDERNAREGWARFVPVGWLAAYNLGIGKPGRFSAAW